MTPLHCRPVVLSSPVDLHTLHGGPWIQNGNELLVVPPKNGSTSCSRYFLRVHDQGILPAREVQHFYYRTFVMRHPMKRLLSAHRHLFSYMPYEQFVDELLSVTDLRYMDQFIRPQCDYLLGLEPTRVVTLETIVSENPGFPRLNTTDDVVIEQDARYRANALLDFYKEDWSRFASLLEI